MKKFLAFFVVFLLLSILPVGVFAQGSNRMGVISASGNSANGSFSCGKVSKSQDACASRSRSSPLAVCVPAPTVCAQAVYYAGAAVGGILVGGLTVYSLDSYGRNFRYETPTSNIPTINWPSYFDDWTNSENLANHLRHATQEFERLIPVPKGSSLEKEFDRLCRKNMNSGRKFVQQGRNRAPFARFTGLNGEYGIFTTGNQNGKIVTCFRMTKKELERKIRKGSLIPK